MIALHRLSPIVVTLAVMAAFHAPPAHAAACDGLTFECLHPAFLHTEIPAYWQYAAPTSPVQYSQANNDYMSRFVSPSGKKITVVVKSPVITKEYDVPPIAPKQDVASYLTNALLDHNVLRNGTLIKFPRATYDMAWSPYSNCNQSYEWLPPASGLTDMVIDGQGSTVNFSAFCNGVGVLNAQRVVLKNFTFAWPKLEIATVGTVISANRNTYSVHVGPVRFGATPTLIAAVIAWDKANSHYDLVNWQDTAYYGDGVTTGAPYQCSETSAQQKTHGCTLVLQNQNSGFRPGQAVIVRYYDYDNAIVANGQDLTFDHLWLENLPGTGFNLQGGRGLRITRSTLTRMGHEPMSSGGNASAIFGSVSGDVVLDHDVFGYSGDDGFQINFQLAQYVVPPSTGNGSPFTPVEPSVANGVPWPNPAAPGDVFLLYDNDLRFRGARGVAQVMTQSGGPSNTSPDILTLDRAIGHDLVSNGFIGADLTQFAGARYVIEDNVFKYTAGRALLLQTPFGRVTNNRFVGQSARQIYLMTSQYWGEGGGGQELTIAHNIFDARGHGGDFLAIDIAAEPVNPSLNIGPEVTNLTSAAPSVNENIIIADNSFLTDRVTDLVNISSANNILFSGNAFHLTIRPAPHGELAPYPGFGAGQYPVSAHDAANIYFDNINQFDPSWRARASCAQSRLLRLTVPAPTLRVVQPAACAIAATTSNFVFQTSPGHPN